MNADQMMRMEPLDILKMLREQVNTAIYIVESGSLKEDSPLGKSLKSGAFLIGYFEIKPRFE